MSRKIFILTEGFRNMWSPVSINSTVFNTYEEAYSQMEAEYNKLLDLFEDETGACFVWDTRASFTFDPFVDSDNERRCDTIDWQAEITEVSIVEEEAREGFQFEHNRDSDFFESIKCSLRSTCDLFTERFWEIANKL